MNDEFLEKMWQKAADKETDAAIFEAVCREEGRISVSAFIKDIACHVGLRRVFAGMADVACIAFTVTILCLWAGYRFVFRNSEDAYSIAFLLAPVLYGTVLGLSWIKESQLNTYAVFMSCKYTFFHLLAFRMFCASLAGIVMNSLYLGILMMQYPVSGIRLFAVSFSSLMIFSCMLVLCLTRMPGQKGRRSIVTASVLWFSANIFAYWNFRESYAGLLRGVPIVLLVLVCAAAIVVYLEGLLCMTTVRFRKGYADAAD